jgi:YD repeat-containing protein
VQRQVQTANGSEVTTYTYDAWGRLRGIDYPRSADVRMGWDGESRRVWVQDGADNPSQVGFVWKVEHKRSADESLLIGYEYTYDLLGRVVQSVEYPSGDKTEYAYTPAGRLASEVRSRKWYGAKRLGIVCLTVSAYSG